MAYVSQSLKKSLAPTIKRICQKYGVRATLAVQHHSTLVLNVKSGGIDFFDSFNRMIDVRDPTGNKRINPANDYIQVNPYWYKEHFDGAALKFLSEVIPAMNKGNHDNSDPQTDYFDVGWYVDVNIGKWDKPYTLVV